jgi:hypothetical protein
LQRHVIAYLDSQRHDEDDAPWPIWRTVFDITRAVHGVPVPPESLYGFEGYEPEDGRPVDASRSQVEAARRAIKRLGAEGVLEVDHRHRDLCFDRWDEDANWEDCEGDGCPHCITYGEPYDGEHLVVVGRLRRGPNYRTWSTLQARFTLTDSERKAEQALIAKRNAERAHGFDDKLLRAIAKRKR